MTRWTTIPRWLYENDLPDDELQEVYVKAARLKVVQLREERDQQPRMSKRWRDIDFMLRQAESFLEEAEAALALYRGEESEEQPRRLATVKELPKP
jgi:hypothetical protein